MQHKSQLIRNKFTNGLLWQLAFHDKTQILTKQNKKQLENYYSHQGCPAIRIWWLLIGVSVVSSLPVKLISLLITIQ